MKMNLKTKEEIMNINSNDILMNYSGEDLKIALEFKKVQAIEEIKNQLNEFNEQVLEIRKIMENQ